MVAERELVAMLDVLAAVGESPKAATMMSWSHSGLDSGWIQILFLLSEQ